MSIVRFFWMILLLTAVNVVDAQDIETVVDSVKSSVKSNDVKEAVTKIKDSFKLKSADAEQMVGKWRYVEPAVYATKGNVLFKMVENTAASQLEKLLQDYIEKCNITPENTTFTFHENGTFERDVVGHKAQGVWMVGGAKLMLAINNVQTADITTHQDGEKLMFLIDVDKLMNIFKLLGAMKDNKTNKALIKLSKHIPGLQAGLSFEKVQKKK
jgi:hypothetical protein